MTINTHYVMVKKIPKKQVEGEFNVVEVQDDFIYRGEIIKLPDEPKYIDNRQLRVGDYVKFAKYSPDTQELEVEGQKVKMVKVTDILIVE